MAHGRQTFLNSATDMKWLREVHLPRVAAGTYKSAILYGSEGFPSRIELFKTKNPKVTDTCVVYVYEDSSLPLLPKYDQRYVRAGSSKPGIG